MIARTATVITLIIILASSLSCGGEPGTEPTPMPKPTPTAISQPTATPTSETVTSPTPTATVLLGAEIQIRRIFYKGNLYRSEANEFVELINTGDRNLNLEGWVLKDITDGYPRFKFPAYVMGPGSLARVYTDERHEDWDRLSFRYDKPIWNNTHPDTAGLYNNHGQLVSTGSYELY